MKIINKIVSCSIYLVVFLLPWQTKLILRSGLNNFQEISLYVSQLVLVAAFLLFVFYKANDRGFHGRLSDIWYFLAGFEFFTFFSFFFAPDKVLAFSGYLVILAGLGIFYLLRAGTSKENYEDSCFNKIGILHAFLASMFLQAVLGIYQFLSQSSFANKYLGLAAHDPLTLGTAVVETLSGRWLRAYGGFDHPNIFGGVLAIALILAAYMLAKKKVINSSRELLSSLFLFVFYFFALFALFFTFSRTAWLAYIIGSLVLLITLSVKEDRWILGRYLAVVFFSALLLLLVVIPYRELVSTRLTADGRLEQKSITERREYLSDAKEIIGKNWLFGVGLNNYTVALEKAEPGQPGYVYQPVHNSFLVLWSQAGALSLLFFLAFLVMLAKKDRQEAFSLAVLGTLVVLMLFDHWLFSLPFGVLFLFFALGLI